MFEFNQVRLGPNIYIYIYIYIYMHTCTVQTHTYTDSSMHAYHIVAMYMHSYTNALAKCCLRAVSSNILMPVYTNISELRMNLNWSTGQITNYLQNFR